MQHLVQGYVLSVSELGTKSRFCSTGSTAFDYQTVLPQALGARMCCSGPLADLAGFRYPSSDVVSLLAKNKKIKKKGQLSNAEVYAQGLMPNEGTFVFIYSSCVFCFTCVVGE